MAVRVRETAPPPKRRRGPVALMAAVAVVVVLALVATAFYFGTRSGGDSELTAVDDPTAPTTSAPAMPTGEASVALGLSTRKVGGYSARGFPRTEAGAVEAAMSWGDTLIKSTSQPDAAALAAVADAAPGTSPAETRQFIAQGRVTSGLDADGSYPDLALGERYYADCLAAYGAYRVTSSSSTSVTVDIWTPCIYGPGAPDQIDRLQILWSATTYKMAWQSGDWRVTNGYGDDSKEDVVPKNRDRVDTTYRERADLLGGGWILFQGSSQSWPSDLLGSEPGKLS